MIPSERWGLLLVVLVMTLIAVIYFVATFEIFPETREVHKADAAAFHQNETSTFLRLPSTAKLLSVEKRSVYSDDYYEILFQLPSDRSPDTWLRHIWSTNRCAPNSRETPLRFSAYHAMDSPTVRAYKRSSLHHGHRAIEYIPARRLYKAEIGTD